MANEVNDVNHVNEAPPSPPTPLPRKTLAVLCCICLIDCINATILNPYVDDMVSMLLKTDRGSPDVSMWVSVLVGSYSICEVVFSAMWGMLADKFGRRPVLLIGLAGSAVAPIIFGMAESLPVALGARLMDGFFCGNVGVARTYLGELVDSSNEAKAFGILASTFSLGLFIGPTLGGTLAYPARWYPKTFEGTIFDVHPFLLANLSYACLAVAALFLGFCALPESRAQQMREAALLADGDTGEGRAPLLWQSFPKGRHLRRILIASSLLFGYVAARLNSFVLVSSLPESMGGMALSPHQFGYIQVCAASMILVNQVTLYPVMMRRLGPHRCFALCLGWTVVISLPIPLYFMVADPRFHFWRFVPITVWQMLSQFGFSTCFPVSVMLINRSLAAFRPLVGVPSLMSYRLQQHQKTHLPQPFPGECSLENRGSINGWCSSLNALSRGLGPPLAGALFRLGCSLETDTFRLGRYLSFYINMITAAVSGQPKKIAVSVSRFLTACLSLTPLEEQCM